MCLPKFFDSGDPRSENEENLQCVIVDLICMLCCVALLQSMISDFCWKFECKKATADSREYGLGCD